uniref:Replication-associated protein n=1 Tax=Turdus hortulorum CRESS-DNA-virus sp. TaxID=2815062 RepID=A0A8A4XBE8_9VIRU|nr:MAG: replication-associated protein [Turdus hortulorum CRESS-DNA-virus sp.]
MSAPAKSSCLKGKYWCFTSFSGTLLYNDATMEYLIQQEEVSPTTMREHIQGYVVFRNRIKLSGLKKLMSTAHWSMARGTPMENYAYCTKEESRKDGGIREEHGIIPASTSQKQSAGAKRQWNEAFAAAKCGAMDSIPADMRIRYYNTFKAIRTDFQEKPVDFKQPTGVWLYGEPGVGKSLFTKQFEHYVKNHNKWWCGYQNEPVALLDDLEPKTAHALSTHLKHWGDAYAFRGEVKGGSLMLRPSVVLVTSNYSQQEIFGRPVANESDVMDPFHRPLPVSVENGSLLGAIARRYAQFCLPYQLEEAKAHIDMLLQANVMPVAPVYEAPPPDEEGEVGESTDF